MLIKYVDGHRDFWSDYRDYCKHSDMCTCYDQNKTPEEDIVAKTPEEQIAELKSAIEQANNAIVQLKKKIRFGVEPSGGSIIKFEKRYNGSLSTKYTYAALREGQTWYLTGTGSSGTKSYTWDELKKFIGDGKAWNMTVKEQIPDGRAVVGYNQGGEAW